MACTNSSIWGPDANIVPDAWLAHQQQHLGVNDANMVPDAWHARQQQHLGVSDAAAVSDAWLEPTKVFEH
eukprot:245216-Pelagomonas_calceolata.AAC.12